MSFISQIKSEVVFNSTNPTTASIQKRQNYMNAKDF